MNDNVLIRDTDLQEEPPATAGGSDLYPLDWGTAEVRLFKGRFQHVLRRPTPEQIMKYDEDLQQDIPIGRDGSYSLPDPTVNEAVEAAIYDQIAERATGYPENQEVPRHHKALAFKGLYQREVEVDPDADLFGDEIPVIDEIGSGIEADFVIRHILRQPTQSELNSYRRKSSATNQVKPGKRGRQIVATRSGLKNAAMFYDLWLVRIDGASVDGQGWSNDNRAAFAAIVDPLLKKKVVEQLVAKLTDGLSD